VKGKSLLVPHVDEFLIPIAQPGGEFGFGLVGLHLLKQETELLAECMQRLPPVAAAVLVLVPHEDLVEEFVDVKQHCFVVRSCHGEGGGGDCGHGFCSSHCSISVECMVGTSCKCPEDRQTARCVGECSRRVL
jgi:hypothetical protein